MSDHDFIFLTGWYLAGLAGAILFGFVADDLADPPGPFYNSITGTMIVASLGMAVFGPILLGMVLIIGLFRLMERPFMNRPLFGPKQKKR